MRSIRVWRYRCGYLVPPNMHSNVFILTHLAATAVPVRDDLFVPTSNICTASTPSQNLFPLAYSGCRQCRSLWDFVRCAREEGRSTRRDPNDANSASRNRFDSTRLALVPRPPPLETSTCRLDHPSRVGRQFNLLHTSYITFRDSPAMRAYKVVDAFSSRPFKGNPVAVILEAEGLSDSDMQSIARWTNLSETTFLLAAKDPAATYRLRIFTPRSELPFAGHPTLGSAHAVLEAGLHAPRDGVLVQECAQGLVRIAVQEQRGIRHLVLDLPAAKVTPLNPEDVDELEAIIGASVNRDASPAIIDVGPRWIVAQLPSADALLDLEPDFARSARFEKRLGAVGLSLFGAHAHAATCGDADADASETPAIEVRSFAPSDGVEEDPVCGSGNGCVAVFRSIHGMLSSGGDSYLATQGRKVGRDGRISVGVDADGKVTIGGACVTCVEGKLFDQ
jgi:PhzF family phenazine biosynthesis protein